MRYILLTILLSGCVINTPPENCIDSVRLWNTNKETGKTTIRKECPSAIHIDNIDETNIITCVEYTEEK